MRGRENDDTVSSARYGISAYRLLRAVASEMLVVRDPERLLARCGDLAQDLLQADACSIAILDQRAGELVPLLTAASGRSTDVSPLPVEQLSGRMLKAIREGRSLIVAHGILIDGDVPIRLAENQSALTAMLIPLPMQGGMHGVLWVGRIHGLPFSPEEQEMAESIAALVALGLRGTVLDKPDVASDERDPLTGLYDRAHFLALLTVALEAGTASALLVLDIDHFAPFNDRYGREAGDRLLHTFGALLHNVLRATDSACRLDGATLAILLPASEFDRALIVATRVRDNFAIAARQLLAILAVASDNHEAPLPTLSVGIAVAPADATTSEALIARAEEALQQAKRDGRNSVVSAQASVESRPSAAD